MILADPALKADWMAELEAMRTGMLDAPPGPRRRAAPRDQLRPLRLRRRRTAACSRASALGPEQVAALRDDYGIYMVGDSRINVAGLPADGLDKLARALVAVGA